MKLYTVKEKTDNGWECIPIQKGGFLVFVKKADAKKELKIRQLIAKACNKTTKYKIFSLLLSSSL